MFPQLTRHATLPGVKRAVRVVFGPKEVNVIDVVAGMFGTEARTGFLLTTHAAGLTFKSIQCLLIESCGIRRLLLATRNPSQSRKRLRMICAPWSHFFPYCKRLTVLF